VFAVFRVADHSNRRLRRVHLGSVNQVSGKVAYWQFARVARTALREREQDTMLQFAFILLCFAQFVHFLVHWHSLNMRLREEARTVRFRNAVNWKVGPAPQKTAKPGFLGCLKFSR